MRLLLQAKERVHELSLKNYICMAGNNILDGNVMLSHVVCVKSFVAAIGMRTMNSVRQLSQRPLAGSTDKNNGLQFIRWPCVNQLMAFEVIRARKLLSAFGADVSKSGHDAWWGEVV